MIISNCNNNNNSISNNNISNNSNDSKMIYDNNSSSSCSATTINTTTNNYCYSNSLKYNHNNNRNKYTTCISSNSNCRIDIIYVFILLIISILIEPVNSNVAQFYRDAYSVSANSVFANPKTIRILNDHLYVLDDRQYQGLNNLIWDCSISNEDCHILPFSSSYSGGTITDFRVSKQTSYMYIVVTDATTQASSIYRVSNLASSTVDLSTDFQPISASSIVPSAPSKTITSFNIGYDYNNAVEDGSIYFTTGDNYFCKYSTTSKLADVQFTLTYIRSLNPSFFNSVTLTYGVLGDLNATTTRNTLYMVFSDGITDNFYVLLEDVKNVNLYINTTASWSIPFNGTINDVTRDSFGNVYMLHDQNGLAEYNSVGNQLYFKPKETNVYPDCSSPDSKCYARISSTGPISIAEIAFFYNGIEAGYGNSFGGFGYMSSGSSFSDLIDKNLATIASIPTSGDNNIYIDVSNLQFDEVKITHGSNSNSFVLSIIADTLTNPAAAALSFFSKDISSASVSVLSIPQSYSVVYSQPVPYYGLALDSSNYIYFTKYYYANFFKLSADCGNGFYYNGNPSNPNSACEMIPTQAPTPIPTPNPTAAPTFKPTKYPTRAPTLQPTRFPTTRPPSGQPTSQPSSDPSGQPSGQPTRQPSSQPSMQPSRQPTCQPSGQPSRQPSSQPSGQPSRQPSSQPSGQPSIQPTSQPTQPTGQPSFQPSSQPSLQPSSQPICRPTSRPTSQPSLKPSSQPSCQPSSQPSMQPSCQPTSQPSCQPSMQPSCQPTLRPSSQPSSQPTVQPSCQPTSRPTMSKLSTTVDTSLYKTGFSNTFYNKYAFAAITINGVAVAWGDLHNGGVIQTSGSITNVKVIKIVSSFNSFAALKSDGTVFAWGQVVIADSIRSSLVEIKDIIPNGKDTYACLKTDGTIVTFGNSRYGGNIVLTNLPYVVSIVATTGAFASLSIDRSVYSWGDSFTGGIITTSPLNIEVIVANRGAFAALSRGGQVFIWGNAAYGGSTSSSILTKISADVAFVFANPRSFVALKKDRTTVSWGETNSGGSNLYESTSFFSTSPVMSVIGNGLAYAAVVKNGTSTKVCSWGDSRAGGYSAPSSIYNISKLFANDHAFAALTSNGSIYTWGDANSGGNSTSIENILTSNKYATVSSTKRAFAAYQLSSPSNIITWGHPQYGGNTSNVAEILYKLSSENPIKKICANDVAFTALFLNGSIVSWGHPDYGGSTPVNIDEITDCHPSSSDATNNLDYTNKFPTLNPSRSPTAPTLPPLSSAKTYLRIVQTKIQIINLAEIELYTSSGGNYVKIPNSALTCTMSSVYNYATTGVENCFDGITDTYATCHTKYPVTDIEYIVCEVAMGYVVSMVKVYNRKEFDLNRINGANLIYSRYSDGSSVLYQSSFGDTAQVLYTFTWLDPTAPTRSPTLAPTRATRLFRYIRCSSTGSSVLQGQGEYMELQVWSNAGTNLALNTQVSVTGTPGGASINVFTDGSTGPDWFGVQGSVKIDLGSIISSADIANIKFWMYWPDGRPYYNVLVEISSDGTNWQSIYGPSTTSFNSNGLTILV